MITTGEPAPHGLWLRLRQPHAVRQKSISMSVEAMTPVGSIHSTVTGPSTSTYSLNSRLVEASAGSARTVGAQVAHCIVLRQHRGTSDGRWSRYERQIDPVVLTESAGGAARTGAFRPATIARVQRAQRPIDRCRLRTGPNGVTHPQCRAAMKELSSQHSGPLERSLGCCCRSTGCGGRRRCRRHGDRPGQAICETLGADIGIDASVDLQSNVNRASAPRTPALPSGCLPRCQQLIVTKRPANYVGTHRRSGVAPGTTWYRWQKCVIDGARGAFRR